MCDARRHSSTNATERPKSHWAALLYERYLRLVSGRYADVFDALDTICETTTGLAAVAGGANILTAGATTDRLADSGELVLLSAAA
jgi:hypothetical protein